MKLRHLIYSLVMMCVMLTMGSCVRHKIVPDDELAKIFHDVFLANAYTQGQNLTVDSLNVYEPIFAASGYTTADIQYTIGNFSKRKSARLGDVVEEAIDLLEEEGLRYDHEVAILDTINNVARREFTRTIFQDSLIRVRSLKDTSRVKLSFDVAPGEYHIRLRYKVDSLDRNKERLGCAVWLERADKSKSSNYTMSLRRNHWEHYSRLLRADSTHRKFCVDFMDFEHHKPQRPSLTIEDMEIRYTPAAEVAVDSLYERQLNLRIFADEFLKSVSEKDCL